MSHPPPSSPRPASSTNGPPSILERWMAAGPRPSRVEHLWSDMTVPAPLVETFAFFADAANLEQLTPPWLNFAIRTPMPVTMGEGLEIEYRIRLYGVAIPWRSRIDVWQPGVRFVDRQTVGPYRWWHHEHAFVAVAGGTRVIDHVEYLPRARWVSAQWVRRDLARIFEFRRRELERVFAR